MPIRLHRVKRLADGSLELWLQGRENDARYVAGLVNQIRDAVISDPYPKPGTIGAFICLSVGVGQPSTLATRTLLKKLSSDREIEIVPLDIRRTDETGTLEIWIQNRLVFQVLRNSSNSFTRGESDDGIVTSGASAPLREGAGLEISSCDRDQLRQSLLDLGVDAVEANAHLQWLEHQAANGR